MAMTPLALLHALHEHPALTFHRQGEGVKVIPAVPPEARPVLAHFRAALLRALEDGERLEARALLSSPYRLAALLAHALGVEGPVVATLYAKGEDEPRRYLAPPGNLTPHLAWAERNLPPPRRVHLAPTARGWALDVREGWEVAVEVPLPRPHVLAGAEAAMGGFLAALHEGTGYRGEVRLWRPGEGVLALPLKEALARLPLKVVFGEDAVYFF